MCQTNELAKYDFEIGTQRRLYSPSYFPVDSMALTSAVFENEIKSLHYLRVDPVKE
jgi:hypothetical protein